jgi:molybdate transport system ATP-binding protein
MPQLPPAPDDRLFFLDDATVVRAAGAAALSGLNWTVRDGETWAIVGHVASGKTTLAETVRGGHRLESGSRGWPFVERLRAEGCPVAWPSDVIHLLSFKEDSWPFSYGRHFYQQRFNFIEPRDDLTLDAFLRHDAAADGEVSGEARRLGLGDCLPLSLIKLSNGQMRRARIARALLARPKLLILDEPFMGLDAAGRDGVADLLGGLPAQGVRLLLVTQPTAVPDWVTHVLELDRLAVRWRGPRSAYRPPAPPPEAPLPEHSPTAGEPIVELRNVTVSYGGRAALRDVTWTVRAGERWAVLGPNGSGKTTLLSLLCGDHPQAYANDIRLFGRQRGSGESIWDIKRRIGLLSPELHLYFTEPLTAAAVAATGFFDVLAYRPTTPEQDATVAELFAHFGIAPLVARPFAQLSTGEQRLVLLVRALVKAPPLLILDEPFQGLDATGIARAREWLDRRLRPDQTLLFVSHVAEELPRTVARRLWLEAGRVVEVH